MNRAPFNNVCYSVVFLCSLALVINTVVHNANPHASIPFGRDFLFFEAASQLTITGHPERIYNIPEQHRVLESLYGARIPDLLPFYYPPYALMLFAPLALLPLHCGWCLWLGIGLLLYAFSIWRSFGSADTLCLALAFPAVLVNLYWGQNAFITVALILGFLYYLDENALMAGLFLGLLFYKPQFAFYCLIAVVAARQWTCFWSALTTLVTLVVGSLLIWGPQLWASYFRANSRVREVSFLSGWVKLASVEPTVFSFLRITGLTPSTALRLQYIVSIAMGVVVYVVWRERAKETSLANSVLGCCILLGVPYYIQYDTLLATIPLSYYWRYNQQVTSAGRTHDGVIFSLWSMPVLAYWIVRLMKMQVVPIICSAVLIRILGEFERVNSAADEPARTLADSCTEGSGRPPVRMSRNAHPT